MTTEDNDGPAFTPQGCRIIVAISLALWVGIVALVKAFWPF